MDYFLHFTNKDNISIHVKTYEKDIPNLITALIAQGWILVTIKHE